MLPPTLLGESRLLSYCTNVHPGETVTEILADLQRFAVPLRTRFPAGAPFPLGLRFGQAAVQELTEDPKAMVRFHAFLESRGFRAYTLNVFPQGRFHDAVVKAGVYEPDWTTEARVEYTLRAAGVLARLLPTDDPYGTLSTVPLGYAASGGGNPATRRALAAGRLAAVAAGLVRLEQETGCRIVLGLEPEPDCLLSRTDELLAFFREDLPPALRRHPGVDPAAAARHLGVCFDACHAAVEFEDPCYSLECLERAGIPVAKIQLSCALEVRRPGENPAAVERLALHDEPRFLHQVVAEDERGVRHRFPDLGPFLRWVTDSRPRVERARCHFHVPIHEAAGYPLLTTREALVDVMARERTRRSVRHFEVETYTFDLLPRPSHVRTGLVDDLEGEIRYAREGLTSRSPALPPPPA